MSAASRAALPLALLLAVGPMASPATASEGFTVPAGAVAYALVEDHLVLVPLDDLDASPLEDAPIRGLHDDEAVTSLDLLPDGSLVGVAIDGAGDTSRVVHLGTEPGEDFGRATELDQRDQRDEPVPTIPEAAEVSLDAERDVVLVPSTPNAAAREVALSEPLGHVIGFDAQGDGTALAAVRETPVPSRSPRGQASALLLPHVLLVQIDLTSGVVIEIGVLDLVAISVVIPPLLPPVEVPQVPLMWALPLLAAAGLAIEVGRARRRPTPT